jgi:TonB family protein
VWDRGGFNFSSAMLSQKPARAVELCVRVDANGQVSEVRASRGDTPFDSAAVDAVRWWWFVPANNAGKPVPAWTHLSVDIQPPADTEPLVPDVIALALDAESRGDLRGAIDLWGGVLARVGVHPSLGDEWSVRERILRLAAKLPEPPAVPSSADGAARGARNLMQRNVARANNADYAARLDESLSIAPWFSDAYRWRAAARAAAGMRAGALRDAACYRIAAKDSATRALADRAIALIAAGDTLTANSILKH